MAFKQTPPALGHLILFLALGVSWINQSECHVSIRFPPARNYALDFLDNVRYVLVYTLHTEEGGYGGLSIWKYQFLYDH